MKNARSPFPLRVPVELMDQIKIRAKKENRSVNNMLVQIIKGGITHIEQQEA